MRGLPDYSLPSLEDLNEMALKVARIVNENVQVIGISINTSGMEKSAAENYLKQVENKMGIPTVDPVLQGTKRLVEELNKI